MPLNSQVAAPYNACGEKFDVSGTILLPRADFDVARCLSVRLSHAGIVSKRLNMSSYFLATPF